MTLKDEPPVSRGRRSTGPIFIVGAHGLGVLFLISTAVYTLGLRCESFGCMGIGLMWMAWAVVFGIVAIIGLVSRSQARKGSARLVQVASLTMATQWLVGVLCLIRWITS
jgi:hypothetical protein